jgi:hypothetical protein
MPAGVEQVTIVPGATVYTDEYDVYTRLPQWGYIHQTVCHAAGEYARDDADGFCAMHVDTLAGFRSLLRSRPRAHGGSRRSGCGFTCGSSSSWITSGGGAKPCRGR